MRTAYCGVGASRTAIHIGASTDSRRSAAPQKAASTQLGPPRLRSGRETVPASGRRCALRGWCLGVPTPRALHFAALHSESRDARRLRCAPPPVARRLSRRAAPLRYVRTAPATLLGAARCAVMIRDAICLTTNCIVRSARTASNTIRTDSSRTAAIRQGAPLMLESSRIRLLRARFPSNVDAAPSVWAPIKKSRTFLRARKRVPRQVNLSRITNSSAPCGNAAGPTRRSPQRCARSSA